MTRILDDAFNRFSPRYRANAHTQVQTASEELRAEFAGFLLQGALKKRDYGPFLAELEALMAETNALLCQAPNNQQATRVLEQFLEKDLPGLRESYHDRCTIRSACQRAGSLLRNTRAALRKTQRVERRLSNDELWRVKNLLKRLQCLYDEQRAGIQRSEARLLEVLTETSADIVQIVGRLLPPHGQNQQ